MRTTTIILLTAILSFLAELKAQDVASNLGTAESSYKSGDLENTRFALQEALNGVNQAIGNEILGLLPSGMGGMSVVEGSDDVTGVNTGFAGLFVSRNYSAENKSASFQIVSDSPLLAGVNTLLTMSAFMSSDPNQKRIKVDGYKALLTKEEGETGGYNLQLPFSSSLLTFECDGITTEEEMMQLVEALPVAEIVKVAE